MINSVNIKLVSSLAQKPEYATVGSAGVDLRACFADAGDKIILTPGADARLVPTGIAFDMPTYIFARIHPRSGLGHKLGVVLGNQTGVIDSDYQGEVFVSLYNRGREDVIIRHGDRIAQMVFERRVVADFRVVDEFRATTDRGAGGFGSTGVA